jgi:hypothetical protein
MARATGDGSLRRERPRRPRRRNGIVYLIGTIVVLALLWLLYWYGANEIASALRERATALATARGYAIECADEIAGGFPVGIEFGCSRMSLAGNTGDINAAIEGLSATSPLYRPGRVEWAATGPFILDAPVKNIGLTASWLAAESKVDFGFGGLSGVTAFLRDLEVFMPEGQRPLPFAGLKLSQAGISVFPGPEDTYRLIASADAVALDTADERKLPEIDLDADISALAFGGSLGLDPRRAIHDWLTRGGKLRIDDLTVVADTVATRYSGDLALSPDGLLTGNLTLDIRGIEDLPDLVESFRPGSRDDVEQVVATVMAFTRPVEGPDGPSRELSLLVRNNVVSIGIIPVAVIPRLPL